MTSFKSILPVVLMTTLAACTTQPRQLTENTAAPATLFDAARKDLSGGRVPEAIDKLQRLEALSPSGGSTDAQLMLIETTHRAERYGDCIAAADRFLAQHPRHARFDQVLYLRGDSYYQRSLAGGDGKTPKDPADAQRAYRDFDFLLTRFPGSNHRETASAKADRLRGQLSGYELRVAQSHLKRGDYAAAINRSRYLIEHYPASPAVPTALAIMADAYGALGMESPASAARALLHSNYPTATSDSMETGESGDSR